MVIVTHQEIVNYLFKEKGVKMQIFPIKHGPCLTKSNTDMSPFAIKIMEYHCDQYSVKICMNIFF